jgi:heme A synthase
MRARLRRWDRLLPLFAWVTVAFTLLVILWGDYVVNSNSGMGCGDHWPTCNGTFVPANNAHSFIEYLHRASSGIDLLLVVLLFSWIWLRGSSRALKVASLLGLIFMLVEALLGAALVLFNLTIGNHQSTISDQALAVAVHLINTFLLFGSLALTALWTQAPPPRLRGSGARGAALLIGILGFLFLGASGAIASFGDILYPARSLAAGFRQDFSPTTSFLIHLRVFHPLIAALVGLYLLVTGLWMWRRGLGPAARRWALALLVLFLVQGALGGLNVLLLVPDWLALLHLMNADLVWICLLALSSSALAERGVAQRPEAQPALSGLD